MDVVRRDVGRKSAERMTKKQVKNVAKMPAASKAQHIECTNLPIFESSDDYDHDVASDNKTSDKVL